MTYPDRSRRRERIEVTGVVQGVGFRPFVHRLATGLGLVGTVGNDSTRVTIEVEGAHADVSSFNERLVAEAPPLAAIDSVTHRVVAPAPNTDAPGAGGFTIVASTMSDGARTLVPPDAAVCADCLDELFDPADRRYRHPFITCTNCGPRYTIITDLPYDRSATTMAAFELCARCRAEYGDPGDRRYHAQPVGCHDCGPQLNFDAPATAPSAADHTDPIDAAAAVLAAGGIVAIKGLGGYHLACDATNGTAVAELRARKRRPDKPFAVMVADPQRASRLAVLSASETDLLSSPTAPIVLAEAAPSSPLTPEVAPGNPLIGLVLPYTPVHHLLLGAVDRPLVMTSANFAGEPLVSDREGIDALVDLYDAVLDNDRPIATPCDDSVVRVVGDRLLPIRRARGFAPIPVPVPDGPPLVAVGAELKNTFCLAGNGRAWVSQHLGDMENLATLRAFESTLERLTRIYDVAPTCLVADLHPAYLSSGWARRQSEPVVSVQHHHAHVAAVMAEAGLDPDTPVVGFAFDGTGYGTDGTIWGGEVLAGSARGLRRVAHLRPIDLPGGDAAVRHPWRVALAHLRAAGIDPAGTAPALQADPTERDLVDQQLASGFGCVPTTSMGRLFDAVSSLIGLRHTIGYEAQAAIDLEMAAHRHAGDVQPHTGQVYRFGLIDDGEGSVLMIDPGPVLAGLLADAVGGAAAELMAFRFHRAVVDMVVDVAVRLVAAEGASAVALSGGVFQNALLVRWCTDALAARPELAGIPVLTHHLVPPNDGGLSLGQAYLALCARKGV